MKENKIISGTLYQKYRPEKFQDVLGQMEVVKSLQNSVENKKIAHAYLFTGGRGSGKTSIARIFAKEIGTSPHDIYEIDAASNRGIDQIRELRSSVEILPLESSHKVFIIDEVHMLTKEAFNALLKTLEEPPKHVIFILATTEINKILDTIISRCQVLEFKKGDIKTLCELINYVAQKEKIKIDKESVEFVAKLGGGSFRDTLSQLQKAVSIFGEDIRFQELEKFFSSSEKSLVADFILAIEQKSTQDLSKIYLQVLEKNIDIEIFVQEVLEKIRISLLIKNSKEFESFYSKSFSTSEIESFKKIEGLNSGHLKKFLETLDLLKKSEKKQIAFEILLHDLI
jgi:DNA polymerase-3 subunit gamma/tau